MLNKIGKSIFSLLPFFFIIFTLTVRIPYRLDAPGDTSQLESFITFENEAESEASIQSVYVMTFNRPTIFQWMMGLFFDSMTLTPLPESSLNVTNTARFESGQVARNTAIQRAIINAYELLGIDISYEKRWLVYLIYDYVDADLEIGDQIVSVNGSDDLLETLNEVACGEEADLIIKRDEEIFEISLLKNLETCLFGISLTEYTHITDLDLAYESPDSFIGGPSAGLMSTLYIYDALSDSLDLTELNIAGTGTIQMDGSVGAVGAIKQKIYTVHQNNVDIFFVPSGNNYTEALKVYDTLRNPTFTLVEVSTFEEVILYLEGVYEMD